MVESRVWGYYEVSEGLMGDQAGKIQVRAKNCHKKQGIMKRSYTLKNNTFGNAWSLDLLDV